MEENNPLHFPQEMIDMFAEIAKQQEAQSSRRRRFDNVKPCWQALKLQVRRILTIWTHTWIVFMTLWNKVVMLSPYIWNT